MKPLLPDLSALSLRGTSLSCGLAALCLTLTACEEPRPRSFTDFMDDRIAREGALARCNSQGEDSQHDIECANARRAEAAIALRAERERREQLERESEEKIQQLTREMAERQQIAREAAREALRQEREAYDALWERLDPAAAPVTEPEPPRDGLSLIELPESLRAGTD